MDAGSGFTFVATVLANTTWYKFVGLDLATSYDFHVTMVLESRYVPPVSPSTPQDTAKQFECVNGTLFVNGTAAVNGTVLVNGTRTNVTVVDDELVVGGPVANASVCAPHAEAARRLAPGGAISSGPPSSSLTVVTVPFAQTIVYPGLSGLADPGASRSARAWRCV